MIIVVADDISGAAEIAAVALRFGLNAQVQTQFDPDAPADLIAIDTDTRCLSREEARIHLTRLAQSLSQISMNGCYKKVDSVLRGHVHVECTALMKGLRKERTLLIPANPSKGRIVRQGQYLIQDLPLDQTEFAQDPEYPVQSSDVTALLQGSIHLVTRDMDRLPNQGIIVGETRSQQDIAHWATQVDDTTLPAGAVDFFTGLMQSKYTYHFGTTSTTPSTPPGPRMIVCGSASPQSCRAIQAAQEHGWPVIAMPTSLTQNPNQPDASLIQGWAADIVVPLSQQGRALTHIPGPIRPNAALPLRNLMARLVQEVQRQIRVTEWVIEGGATGRAILDRLAWRTLNIQGLYGPGVVQMQVAGLHDTWVTLKPGSYPWPQGWWY